MSLHMSVSSDIL